MWRQVLLPMKQFIGNERRFGEYRAGKELLPRPDENVLKVVRAPSN